MNWFFTKFVYFFFKLFESIFSCYLTVFKHLSRISISWTLKFTQRWFKNRIIDFVSTYFRKLKELLTGQMNWFFNVRCDLSIWNTSHLKSWKIRVRKLNMVVYQFKRVPETTTVLLNYPIEPGIYDWCELKDKI